MSEEALLAAVREFVNRTVDKVNKKIEALERRVVAQEEAARVLNRVYEERRQMLLKTRGDLFDNMNAWLDLTVQEA